MSDNWIILIPDLPDFAPTEEAQELAVQLFRRLAPRASEVKAETSTRIRFIDCGGNFEQVLCPDCHKPLDMDWWSDRMNEEHETGYPLVTAELPCCQSKRNVSELKYEWPMGFARFSLEAMNPDIRDLSIEDLAEFERLLGSRVKVIFRHL